VSSFEEIAVVRGRRSEATMAIAVHSTTLGPALGGVRMWHYTHDENAIADAMRLAESMTHKAAAAELDLGGGKGVISVPEAQRPEGELRRALLLDFADLVESLEGRYVTAEDVGTGADDMAVIAERTAHVVGLAPARGGSGDPSPLTALGVRAAMRACTSARFGTGELAGLRVTVIGFGHVGAELVRLLQDDGSELVVAEIDPSKRELARALGVRCVDSAEAAALPSPSG
jgi:leucine dehydrogenase